RKGRRSRIFCEKPPYSGRSVTRGSRCSSPKPSPLRSLPSRAQRGTCFLRYKPPVSVLVIVYTPDLDVLLIERADYADHWQSVTGSVEIGETLHDAAVRELAEEPGIDAAAYGGVSDWNLSNVVEILPQWRHRCPPGPG